MSLKELQRNWNSFAQTDPLWAILTDPTKKGNKWRITEFFKTGEREINSIMKHLEAKGISIPAGRALDFGCGIGRLTQALANYFDETYGADIAPAMLKLAKHYNRHGDKCKYFLNTTSDLRQLADNSFSCIYTNITLQHMDPKYSKSYLKDFIRILVPDGLLIFQIPSRSINSRVRIKLNIRNAIPKKLIGLYYRARHGQAIMETHTIEEEDVIRIIEKNGGKMIDIIRSTGSEFISCRYFAIKNNPTIFKEK